MATGLLRKQLALRSRRRGMREMDLLLGPFADSHLAQMDVAELGAYRRLLDENDQEIYAWILAEERGTPMAPARHADLIAHITSAARKRMRDI